jgi:hypothetical protein
VHEARHGTSRRASVYILDDTYVIVRIFSINNNVPIETYMMCIIVRRRLRDLPRVPSRSPRRMPFAGPETTLAATAIARIGVRAVESKIVRPGASQEPSTTFQSLTRRVNDLRRIDRNFSVGRLCRRCHEVGKPLRVVAFFPRIQLEHYPHPVAGMRGLHRTP